MPGCDEQFKEALSDLSNALQTAVLLVTRQRRRFDDLAQDAIGLEAAIERAVDAAARLPRDGARETGGADSNGAPA